MSDIISLSNNADNYLRKGMNALNQGQYEQALDAFNKSFQLTPNPQVFVYMVQLMIDLKLKDRLDQLWQEAYPQEVDRLQDDSLARAYIESLNILYPLDLALIKAYQIKDQFSAWDWDLDLIETTIDQLQNQIALKAKIISWQDAQVLDTFINELLQQPAFEILATLKACYQLNFEDCSAFYLKLLTQDKLLQFIKSDILHHLLYQEKSTLDKIQDPFPLNWMGQIQQISLKNLKPYREVDSYQAVYKRLETYCQSNNPHLFDALIEQWNLIAMVYYPFIDQVVDDPDCFTSGLLAHFQLESNDPCADASPEHLKTLKYLEGAQKELIQLI